MIARPSLLVFLLLSVFALAAVTGCGQVKRPDGGVGLLPEGARAPDVAGRDPSGREVRLSDQRGRMAVVYFYPQDGTPGCTKEACAFRDAWKQLEQADVAVFGVSTNFEERHQAFQKQHALPFPLVSDESGAIGAAYGVSKKLWGYDRVTFLVGRDGRIAKVWPDVDPAVHARDVLAEAARAPGAAADASR